MASSKKKTKHKSSAAQAVKSTTQKVKEAAAEVVEIAETIEAVTDTVNSERQAQYTRLHKWNKWWAAILGMQGIAIALLGSTKEIAVTSSFLTHNPIATELNNQATSSAATRVLFDINLAWLVALFLFAGAAAHLFVATKYRTRYETDLAQGVNRVRWFEHGFAAGLMLVTIALLVGVYDLASLAMIFGLNLIMSLAALTLELHYREKGQTNRLVHRIACIAGVLPWLVFAWALTSAGLYGNGGIPAFVYWIFGSMLVLFAGYAKLIFFENKKTGKWADTLYVERLYMILSLIASTALAWQVYAGILRP